MTALNIVPNITVLDMTVTKITVVNIWQWQIIYMIAVANRIWQQQKCFCHKYVYDSYNENEICIKMAYDKVYGPYLNIVSIENSSFNGEGRCSKDGCIPSTIKS